MFSTPNFFVYFVAILLLVVSLDIKHVNGAKENFENQAQLISHQDGNLLLETALDRNITVRLMGYAATVLVNDINMLDILQRRQREIAAARAAERREPLTLETIKEQFRSTQRDLRRLGRRLTKMKNDTQRNGPNQRTIRRNLQRIQRIDGSLTTMEKNLVKDECKPNPCQNGGICYDAYKAFQCDCTAGWEGPTCENDVNECFDLAGTDLAACQNNAQCVNTLGSYRCVCRNGFTGTHCRLRHNVCLAEQSKELCGDHGTCIHSNMNAEGFVCICDQGWTWANTNATIANPSPCTRDVDECRPDINPCHRGCINLPGSYRCEACPAGYTGDGKYCRDIDECTAGGGEENGGCSMQPRVPCINTEGSYRCGRCPPGWSGDGRTCDPAESDSCKEEQLCHPQATCNLISGTVVCSCRAGYYGHGYGSDGCSEDSDRQPCDGHLCQNNATCVLNGHQGTSCICQPGYTGALCDKSDACHPNPCQNRGTCRLLQNNDYECRCPAGYTNKRCSSLRFYCGVAIRGVRGQLRFPPYNDESTYQPDERCPFILRTTPGFTLNVTFGFFDVQNSTDCHADFLQLHDGNSLAARLIGTFCGSSLPQGNGTIISTHEQIFFWFRSDNQTEGRGFNFTWTSKPMVCGNEIKATTQGETGIIRTPGYPGKAGPGLDCRWLITGPFGSRVMLRFYDITLGTNQNGNCSEDSLTIYDADRQLYVACESAQPAPLHSSSNEIRLDFHTDTRLADSSFQLHYEIVPGEPGCGGLYTEPAGRISGHMNAEICLYLIEQPPGTQIQLNFLSINLLGSDDSDLQTIEIFDGRTEDDPLLKRFSGTPMESELEPITSTGEVVLVRYEYKLRGLKLKTSFELSYTRVCNVQYRGDQNGIMTTPNYPNFYFGGLTCTFLIQGPVNYIVKLNITDLNFSLTNDETSDNYLDIFLSRDEKRRFNKTMRNEIIVTQLNEARLIFHSTKMDHIGRGLSVEYKFIFFGGGGVINHFHSSSIVLFEPFCQFIIEVPGRKHIEILMVKKANIMVFDNSTNKDGYLLTSKGFEGNGINVLDEDFDANVLSIILKPATLPSMCHITIKNMTQVNTGCGGISTQRYGIIKSPNWPRPYAESKECIWIIRAPLGHRIELVVHNFTLEILTNNCAEDYLEVRNGDMILSPLIGRYCGERIPSRIPSIGNALYIKFVSDESTVDKGFYINWQMMESGCGGILNSPVGAIHSPHSIQDTNGAVSCDWQILVAQGSRINMELQSSSNKLCNGQLIIYDGPTTQSRPLRLNCTYPSGIITLHSTSNRVLVRYDVSNDEPDGINFVLDYKTDCNVKLDQLSGAIETPNFPNNYPPNMICKWDIKAGDGKNHIQLAFSHLTLESPRDCDYDFVMLTDMQNEQILSERRLCDIDQQIPITSDGNRIVVSFRSDNSVEAQGFHAEYRRVGCGEELKDFGGRFESPNAPYSVDLDCNWLISAPAGKRIRLLLQDLHIETPQPDCSEDALTIAVPMADAGNNSSSTSLLLRSCQIDSSVQTLISPGNELTIRFRSSKTRARKYFKATYVLEPASCGGYSSSSSGLISSPGFHQQEDGAAISPSATDIECIWELQVPNSYGISLQFAYFNLTDSPNCSTAFIELTKIDTDSSEHFLERGCGNEKLLIRLVHGNKMRVRYKVKANSYGRFALRYERQCGGTLTAEEGYLRSRIDENCNWVISATDGSKINLKITKLECPKCPQGRNCTDGLSISNDDDKIMLYSFCDIHPVSLIVQASSVGILAKGINFEGEYSNLDNTCGGIISSVRGTLGSPNFPYSYPSNVECVWSIDVQAGNAIELTIGILDIVKSEHCNEDFLEIRSGIQGPLLGLYCDNNLPLSPLYSNTSVWIKFRSMPENTAKGFLLRWTYVHNNELIDQTNGTIDSPPKLSVLGDTEPYTWRILVKREMSIKMQFVEYNSGLMLYDGYDTTALPVTIDTPPWQFTSSSNVLYLMTSNVDFDTFRLIWHAVSSAEIESNRSMINDECHKAFALRTRDIELITSPGYPKPYKHNLNCEWTFTPLDHTESIVVQIYVVELEAMNGCDADYLQMQSSSNLIDWNNELRLCNNSSLKPIPLVRGTPNLRIQFVSDASINAKGFSVRVFTGCGSNMTDPVGIINASSIKDGCEWHIEVRPGKKIDITIEYTKSIVPNDTCPLYGVIYDGLDNNAPTLINGKFCNQPGFDTKQYRTSGPHAFIKYSSNSDIMNPSYNTWRLTYREFNECNGEIQLTELANSYNISTPGYPYYPHPHSECTWLVIGPPGETIAANFVDRFDLSTRQCEDEYVELYDGSTQMAERLFKSCSRPKTTIRTSNNLLLIHYLTNLDEPHIGFLLNVSLSNCGGVYTSSSGFISSENYPALGAYPKSVVCTYSLKLPSQMTAQLNFTDVHLPFDKDDLSRSDSIEIIDLNTKSIIFVLYGNTSTPLFLPLNTNELAIRFKSVQSVNNYRGFKLLYERTFGSCHRRVNAPSGTLSTPFYQVMALYRTCLWRITVPKGQRVRLQFLNLADIQEVNQTASSSLLLRHLLQTRGRAQPTFAFFNDELQNSEITKFNLRDYNGSGIVESTDNFMLAMILVYKLNLATTTLRADFSSIEPSLCPPDIADRASGTLSIEPLNNLTTYYCKVKFVTQPDETITFKIEEYLFQTKGGSAAIIFRDDIRPTSSNIMTVNTTNSYISMVTTSGYIRLLQNNNIRLKRFRASYRRHRCGGRIILDDSTMMNFPPQNEQADDDYGQLECVWSLVNSRGYELFGTITLYDRCDREYLVIFSGAVEVARLCRGMTELNTTRLQRPEAKVIYHSSQYRPGRTQFTLRSRRSLGANLIYVGQGPSPAIEVTSNYYKNNMELSWDYLTSKGLFLVLHFTGRFFIEASPNCTNDQLQVQSYKNDLWHVEKTLCGRELPSDVVVHSTKMRIVFRTNSNITGDGFVFTVSNTCNAALIATEELQTLASPRWQGSKRSQLDCSYDIYTDTQMQLVINVKNKGIGSWSDYMCTASYFKAFKFDDNNVEQLIDRFCPDFEVTGYRKLRINYISSLERRFELQYQLWACGGNFTEPFDLHSPKGEVSGLYADNINCIWHITAPPRQAIYIEFKYLDMETSTNCIFDELSIYKGSSIIEEQRLAILCGNATASPPTFMINSNQAVIMVRTDHSNSGRGFLASVRFTPNCNEHLILSEGNNRLSLMRHYHINKSEELICNFQASAPPTYRISVELKNLQLNNEAYLEILDSPLADSSSLAKYSNVTGNRPKLYSSYEDLSILLKSGKQTTSSNVSFEVILEMERTPCGERQIDIGETKNVILRLRRDSISRINATGTIHCTWKINFKMEAELRLRWLHLREVSQLTGKCDEYLKLKAFSLTRYYCGQFNNSYEFISNYGDSYFELTFHTDGLDENSGFEVAISERVMCNRTYTDLSGFITYRETSSLFNCTDYIQVSDYYSLTLRVLDVQFDWSDSVKYLNVTDLKANHTLLNITSNQYSTITKFTTTNELLLEMADVSNMRLFYYATSKNLPSGCGGNITTLEGYLVNPPYDNRNYSVCTWLITPSPILNLMFNFLEFDMGTETNCQLDNIKFYEISADGSEKLRQTLCGQGQPQSFVITSNRVRIVAKKSPNFDGTGFHILFSQEPE